MSTDDRFQQAARAVSAGLLRYGAGDLRGAAEELRRALQLAPDYPRAQRYLGWVQRCLREQGPGRPPAPPLVAPLSAAPEQISSASALTPPLSHERKTGLKQVED